MQAFIHTILPIYAPKKQVVCQCVLCILAKTGCFFEILAFFKMKNE